MYRRRYYPKGVGNHRAQAKAIPRLAVEYRRRHCLFVRSRTLLPVERTAEMHKSQRKKERKGKSFSRYYFTLVVLYFNELEFAHLKKGRKTQ